MNKAEIIAELHKTLGLSVVFQERLSALLVEETYQPHQIIDSPGNQHHRMWLIASGIVRTYYFNDQGKQMTEAFYLPGELLFFWEGYLSHQIDHYVEALQLTRALTVRYAEIPAIRQYPEGDELIRYFIAKYRTTELFKSRLLSKNAEERYREFRKVYPLIFREVPLKLIASYLNMTRENLSRLISSDR